MVQFTDSNIQKLFGVSDAENEKPERLKEFFYKNRAYENLANDLPIRILVGHKGSGKSALLKTLYLEDQENDLPAIWLQPGDVLDVFDSKKGTFNSWIENWKNTLLNVITNQIVQEIQPEFVRENFVGVANTASALLNLVRTKIEKVVAGGAAAIQKDAVKRFTENQFIRIYIDDLDRGWKAREDDIRRISTLLNAIRDLCGSSNALQFRIGLRSDVYYLVRTSDESTDKIEDKIVFLTWSSHDLLVLFAKRIETFFGRKVDEALLTEQPQAEIARTFHQIMDRSFLGQGKWSNAPIHRVLMSLQRQRPRDLVKLLGGASKAAYRNNHDTIRTSDFRETFSNYSAERLQDLVNEFGSEISPLDRLLLEMKPRKKEKVASEGYMFSQDALDNKIAAIKSHVQMRFTNKTPITTRSVGQFLYKIDFIVARKKADDGTIIRRFFDQSRFLFDQHLDFGFSWEIHPAYRWALQPDTLESLFEEIDLNTDP
jgi:hypothetical protein